jgi:hypothetical protein
VAGRAGAVGKFATCRGATWIDYDNEGYPIPGDRYHTVLFQNPGQTFRRNYADRLSRAISRPMS